MTKTFEKVYLLFSMAIVGLGAHYYGLVMGFLLLALFSDIHIASTIAFKAIKVLNSIWWYLMFLSLMVGVMITCLAIYLVLVPWPEHEHAAALIWLGGFAIKRLLFAIGFRGHTEDMVAIFNSDDYTAPLPAAAPTPTTGVGVSAAHKEETEKVLSALTGLSVAVKEGVASSERLEQHAEGLATDLSDSHKRADAVNSDNPGAAADAAAQQTKKEKMVEEKIEKSFLTKPSDGKEQ